MCDRRINVTIEKSLETYFMILINVPILKSLETYLINLVSKSAHTKKSGNLFNDPHINVPILKKSANFFNDPGINVPI